MGADQGEISGEVLRSIRGNASVETKELVQRLMSVLASDGFGTRTARHVDIVEVSIVPDANEPTRQQARVVLEVIVTEDMLNVLGTMHGACIVHLVDLCTTLPIAAITFSSRKATSVGVSQSINTLYHAPASLGDKLRLINTSTTVGTRVWNARVEIWNVTHHRLVASATHVKMQGSSKL